MIRLPELATMGRMAVGTMRHNWRYWMNRENVVIRSRHTVDGRTDWAIHTVSCKRRSMQFRDLAGGIYTQQDIVWCVPAELVAPLGGMKPSDVIEDAAGDSWLVLESPLNTWGSWYRCLCRNFVMAYDLRDLIDIWAPTNSADAQGHRSPTLASIHTAIPGRLQPLTGEQEEVFGKLGTVKKYTAYLANQLTVAQQVAITAEMQIRLNGSTTAYQVTGWRNPGKIDSLLEIDCEVMP